jgi:hypothetical protein
MVRTAQSTDCFSNITRAMIWHGRMIKNKSVTFLGLNFWFEMRKGIDESLRDFL